jgi:hypothetical protein
VFVLCVVRLTGIALGDGQFKGSQGCSRSSNSLPPRILLSLSSQHAWPRHRSSEEAAGHQEGLHCGGSTTPGLTGANQFSRGLRGAAAGSTQQTPLLWGLQRAGSCCGQNALQWLQARIGRRAASPTMLTPRASARDMPLQGSVGQRAQRARPGPIPRSLCQISLVCQ